MNFIFVFLVKILTTNVDGRDGPNYDRIVHFGDSYILFRFVSGPQTQQTKEYFMTPDYLEITIHTKLEYFSFGWNVKAEFGGDLIFVGPSHQLSLSSKKGIQ